MSSNIKFKSSYVEANNGDAALYAYEFSHEKEVKEISIENVGNFSESSTLTADLVSGSVSVGPLPFNSDAVIPAKTSSGTYQITRIVTNDSDESEILLGLTGTGGTVTTSAGFPVGTVSFYKNSFTERTSRNIDYLYNVDKDGNYIVQSYDSPLLESQTSFGLLRTNPKLTGNIKITVDSEERVWLNSIDANKELADSRFKKFAVSTKSNLAIDSYRFFDNGKTPPEIVYDLYQQAGSYFSTQRSLSGQYDRLYTYGAEQLKSKFYAEDFSFFAPLRINEILPEYFIIFRANGPLNEFTYSQDPVDWKKNINAEILKKADIVRVFDLSETSRIGTYIRNLKDHPARKDSEMTVSFQRDGYTTFNGISYTEGSFAQKGELLADFFDSSVTILGTEEFLTLGFQRNKILSSSIINLEFLFDDPDAPEFSINRYFGLYMRKNEIASFFLSDKALEQYSSKVGQFPLPRRGVDGNKLSSRSFIQTNESGIRLYANTTSFERSANAQNVFTTRVSGVDPGGTAIYFAGQWENSPYLSLGDAISFYAPGSTSVECTGIVDSISQENKNALIGLTSFQTLGATISSLNGYSADFYTSSKDENRKISVFSDELIQSSRLFYLQDKLGNFYNVNSTREVQTKVDSFTYLTDIEIKLNEKKVDVANFTGTDEMMTQTPAELLNSPGRSVIEIEITDAFKDHDYIEISASVPSFTEPLRWRLKAQTPMLNAGQFWPDYSVLDDYSIETDTFSKFYMTVFHPGTSSNLNELASTIVNAFSFFPYTVFDIASKDNKIYIRSKESGEVANSLKLVTSISNPSVKVYGYYAPLGEASVNFLGGTERNKNRAKISREVAEGILSEEYFQTVGIFSKLKEYDVYGNSVRYYSYLDQPEYDDFDKISGFSNTDEYAVVQLENDNKFQLTYDSKITSYSIHRAKFGIFSFFPLRDFDTDYLTSDYSKNYDAELAYYFNNIGAKTYVVNLSSPLGATVPEYTITFPEPMGLSGSYTFLGVYEDSRSPLDYNGKAELTFNGPTASTASLSFYRGTSGINDIDSISLIGSNVPSKLVILPDEKILYFEENELSKFKGFFSLSPVITSQDLRTFSYLESQWSFSRFFLSKISSEYQRLQENFQKDLALTSKVVPYVAKWVSPDGKDVRDNPYRLNYNRAFGTMNFTPSQEFPEANSKVHTHEWPYLANVPVAVDPMKFADLSFSYFFEKPDIGSYDFYSVTKDWFSEYFVTGYPTEIYKVDGEDKIVPIETSERYSIFKYDNLSQKTFTIFRGIRLEVGEEMTPDGALLVGAQKYDGYKFSSVIVPFPENDSLLEESVVFDVIVNEKFKFILNLIKVRISSYKNLEGNLSYVDLYTLENKRNKASYVLDSSKVSPFGYDFRFNLAMPSDIEFPSSMNPGVPGTLKSGTSRYDLRDFLKPLTTTGEYSFAYSVLQRRSISPLTFSYSKFSNVFSSSIQFETPTFSRFSVALSLVNQLNNYNQQNIRIPQQKFYYAGGGDSYYNRTRDFLSFFEISKVLQKSSEKLTANIVTISSTGSTVPNKILFRVISPEKYLTRVDYYPVPDKDKPSELYNYEVIGASIVTENNPQYLYRYQGNFIPKFKDIFFFGSREEERFAMEYNNDFKLANTFIAEELIDTFYLRNQYFSKVADEEILRIKQDSGYKSLYPLVDEISIDKRDLFTWNSSWDNLYYRKYSTVSSFDLLKGTEEMKEIKSFLGSKMMKIQKEFSLYEFVSSGDSPEISYTEDGNMVTVTIDAYSKFLRELMGTTAGDAARYEFFKISQTLPLAIAPEEVDVKTEEYLRKNIIDLFEVENVNFYLLQTGNTGSLPGEPARPLIQTKQNGVDQLTLNERELINNRYLLKKDVKVTVLPDLKIQLQYLTDSRFYTSLGFGVDLRRI